MKVPKSPLIMRLAFAGTANVDRAMAERHIVADVRTKARNTRERALEIVPDKSDDLSGYVLVLLCIKLRLTGDLWLALVIQVPEMLVRNF